MFNHIDEENITRIDKLIYKGNNVLALYPSGGGSSAYNNYNNGSVLTRGMPYFQKKQSSRISDAQTSNESPFTEWQSQVLSFLTNLLGTEGTYTKKFEELVTSGCRICVERGQGVLRALKEDISQGYLTKLKSSVTAEVFADFVVLANQVLPENKDVAAVLICAALEDALKRLGIQNELGVTDKDMAEVINALAGKGILQGPQLSTIRSYTKLRNAAFHAKWGDIDSGTVGSAISFTEEFLKDKFQ